MFASFTLKVFHTALVSLLFFGHNHACFPMVALSFLFSPPLGWFALVYYLGLGTSVFEEI